LNLNGLDKDEKRVIDFLVKEGKAVFQADLKEKLEIGKVKTTRLLDKLEAKQLIERKRRGMNNIVVLKD
ncbi:MAG: MarR family transcriptional regulator, partial [Nanoarchaeota archaeon]